MSEPKPKETRAYLYKISHEPGFLHAFFDVPWDAIEKLNSFYPRLDKDPAGCIPDLIELCREYPTVPQCKNLLGVAYQLSGSFEKATEVNNLTIKEHPDYLFAKINKAFEYLSLNQPEKVIELLGPWIEIKEVYPERDIFHVAEVLAFYKLAFHYHLAMDNFEIAKSQLQVMETVDPDHADTRSVQQRVLMEEIKRSRKDLYSFANPKKRKK